MYRHSVEGSAQTNIDKALDPLRHGHLDFCTMSLQTQPLTATPDQILQIAFGFWASKTMLSSVQLGVYTALAGGPLDARELASRLQLHPRGALDFFDTLVALGLLHREAGLYRNTPVTEQMLDRNKPSYVGGFMEMAEVRLYSQWGALTEALRTGKQQNEGKASGDTFADLYADPNRLKLFLAAMTGGSMKAAQAIAAQFPWRDYQTFADVGCAQGCLPVQVALAQPQLRGVGYDLPVVGPIFEEYVAGFGLQGRVTFQAGSFFDDPLPKADVIVMGHILHDWDLPTKHMLLRKACDALPVGGAVVVHEAIIDDARCQNVFGLLMSLNMLIETPGGFDFTGADCQGWMREAGFRHTRVEHLDGPNSMVVGIK